MRKTVLTFGLLSGALSVVLMYATMPFAERIGFDRMLVVGYTSIVIAMLFVYFGIRSYRDNVLGGTITFSRGFNVGLLITLITCACYVTAWLVLFYTVMPDFPDKYAAHLVEGVRASGGSQAEIDAMARSGEDMKKMLRNPLINAAVTFTEPFPVGLLVTLISAAVLKNKTARE
jgi:hypothetical protein